MIKLIVADYCHDCPGFVPVKNVRHTSYTDKCEIDTNVFCENFKVCQRMYEHIERKVRSGDPMKYIKSISPSEIQLDPSIKTVMNQFDATWDCSKDD